MKVFLSWSGNESKQLAKIFKEWLPNVLQYVEPYMSEQDIDMGERWGNNIADNLENSVFGLVFVTPSNIKEPWINFEAGALSKTIDARVIPILYKAEVTILDKGPLRQFQSAKNLEEASILSLIQSINASNQDGRLDETRLVRAFEMWWPKLSKAIDAIVKEETESIEEENGPTDRELLNVIYSKLIEQEKMTSRSKESLGKTGVPYQLIRDLEKVSVMFGGIHSLLREDGIISEQTSDEWNFALSKLEKATDYLSRRGNIINYPKDKLG
ncbi:toll/interleukin-1 receptor domain-containing protein [Bacillus cereus]|uniref:toll/interleukin-1 receptor domain-containing protein n=1 Tax=Bacillus cereus TaxID=1396 RepID=UPI0039808CD1